MTSKIARAMLLGALGALVPMAALGQAPTAPGSSKPPASATTTAKPPAAATTTVPKAPAASTSMVGVWTGQVQEIGRQRPFGITVSIDAKGAATTDYPEQGCAGKLTRVGSSGGYVFYSEKITKGAYDTVKGTGCLDGTVVVTKAGASLLFSWFGSVDNQPVQASATLALSKPKV